MDKTSLIDTSPTLPGLDVTPGMPVAGELDRMGEYTATRFFAQHPDTYKAISNGMLEGLSDAALCRQFGCHHRTVAAIRAREMQSMSAADYRRVQGGKTRASVMAMTDEINSRLADAYLRADIPFGDLIRGVDKLSSQERLLAGEPTQIVGHVQPTGADEDLRGLIEDPASIHSSAKKAAEVSGTTGLIDADCAVEVASARAREGQSIDALQPACDSSIRDVASRLCNEQVLNSQAVSSVDTCEDTSNDGQAMDFDKVSPAVAAADDALGSVDDGGDFGGHG